MTAQLFTESARRTLAAKCLTPRRLRAQAIVLAVCLWGVCPVDFATPGLFDRAGNIKFQDFLPLYISARLVAEHRPAELYSPQTAAQGMQEIIRQPSTVRLPYLYGPQVALFFSPLARFSFLAAAGIWAALSLLTYSICIYLVWKRCPALRSYPGMVALAALAFPPLFHFFVRAQISALVLACFTASFLAWDRHRDWLAGVALGCLIFKPQFLVAIPLVLLLAHAWKPLTALGVSAITQLFFTRIYFGPAVMHAYLFTLLHMNQWLNAAELSLAPIQMHSLRAFWTLLVPWPTAAFVLYVLTSIAAIIVAASIWKSSSPLALRFSALTLAAVLVNPHLFVYDLLTLAPVLLLLADWATTETKRPLTPTMRLLTYLGFTLPLLGPLSRWTHLQVSVLALLALLVLLSRISLHQPSRPLRS